jgi:hypothetical protein
MNGRNPYDLPGRRVKVCGQCLGAKLVEHYGLKADRMGLVIDPGALYNYERTDEGPLLAWRVGTNPKAKPSR